MVFSFVLLFVGVVADKVGVACSTSRLTVVYVVNVEVCKVVETLQCRGLCIF